MGSFKAFNSIIGGPNKQHNLSRRESQSKMLKGPVRSCVSFCWMMGLPVFIILSLFNIGVSILRLENHRILPTHEVMMAEHIYSGSHNNYRAAVGASWQRPLLPPSIWSTRKLAQPVNILPYLSTNQTEKAKTLCGKFVYSTLQRAIRAGDMAEEVFVATGDIDFMWIRDSVVQMSTYLNHHMDKPWLRFLVEGAIRRNAFNIIQDPYANAFYHEWKNPDDLSLKDRVIGRGGWVATRNYELDSGAYFLCHIYDYVMAEDIYRPEELLQQPMIFEAVMLMVETWIVEQHHEEQSPYRYFELPRDGLGSKTQYTGMTWTGFRPSDDACKHGYLIPANIHAAAALERVLILNDRIWRHKVLGEKASKLLYEIEMGIKKYGIVTNEDGKRIYAYEVDGLGGILTGFDDANIPSLLSIPLLGWSGYDHEIFVATRQQLLSNNNLYYFEGSALKGIGSPHTPKNSIWPMALVVQGLTEEGDNRAEKMAFQMKQLLLTACHDSMHESNNVDSPCRLTRTWFEWANSLFVLYTEATLGVRCDAIGSSMAQKSAAARAGEHPSGANFPARTSAGFYSNRYNSNASTPEHYQGVAATVLYETSPSLTDFDKKIKNEVIEAMSKRDQRTQHKQANPLPK